MKILSTIPNKQGGGILQVIIFLIVIICILAYFHITFSSVIGWIMNAFSTVFGH